MSASSSPPHFPHRIAIIVSPDEGRFLQCIDCKLRFEFPDGAEFGTIAKQFTETCSNDLRPETSLPS